MHRHADRPQFWLIVGALLLSTGATTAFAESFQVEAWAIRASKTNSTVSPELKPILSSLRRVYPQYKGFKLERRAGGKVESGKRY
ncbi:MAG: hypothetical protein D6744_13095, partial [Planctomycetota bacterium]